MSLRNLFAGPYLERDAHLRNDPGAFAAALADERSRAVPVWNSRNLISCGDEARAVLLPLVEARSLIKGEEELVLLGRIGAMNCFAFEVDSVETPPTPPASRYEDLRTVAALLPAEEVGLLGYARALMSWRRRHRFCGTCGSQTAATKHGHVLACTNQSCGAEQFPRIDPAIIVLVSDGERALLGRHASWPAGRYSTIAGFVEPGESLEDAVAREVLEETGIEVESIAYHSSQPWPFPSSLMLGYTARAASTKIEPRDRELEDVRWFSRADLVAGVPLVPPSVSISFRLIEHWFNAGSATPLRAVLAKLSRP